MITESFYDRLLLLPLFQGIGKTDFYRLAERIPMGFHRLSKGKFLVKQDEKSTSLNFVIEGSYIIKRTSANRDFILCEWSDRPIVVHPECLFGLNQNYRYSLQANKTLHTLEVNKSAVRDVLLQHPTFRLNYLNILSAHSQRANQEAWTPMSEDLLQRFIRFLQPKCTYPAGKKEIHIRMDCLAKHLLTTRLRVSQLLNNLESEGLVELYRQRIIIPQLELLINGKKHS